jgi:hypothetical protein
MRVNKRSVDARAKRVFDCHYRQACGTIDRERDRTRPVATDYQLGCRKSRNKEVEEGGEGVFRGCRWEIVVRCVCIS